MNSIFTFTNDNTDFGLLKKQGAGGVLIAGTDRMCEKIKKAAASEMDILVEMSAKTAEGIKKISTHAGRVSFEDEEIRYVSLKDIKKTLSLMGSAENEVSGFIIPMPGVCSLIWNDDIDEMCGFGGETDDALYQLFDGEIEISSARSWYYENAGKYILEKYMRPVKEFLEKIGKRAIFDMGDAEIQYDLAKKMINPIMLKREGFSLALRTEKGRKIEAMGLGNGDFFIYEDCCEMIEDKTFKNILLVKPARGVMQRLRRGGGEFARNRIETPALAAGIEGVYFCERLTEKGYCFDVCDEFSFDGTDIFGGYEHILICESCLFTKTEMSVIDGIKDTGVKVNDEKLIRDLAVEGEEEWEK